MIYTFHYSEPFSATEETKTYNAKDSAEAVKAFRRDVPVGRINLLRMEHGHVSTEETIKM